MRRDSIKVAQLDYSVQTGSKEDKRISLVTETERSLNLVYLYVTVRAQGKKYVVFLLKLKVV